MLSRYDSSSKVEVHALASGSSGNATLITSGGVSILIDAGLGIRKLTSVLNNRGIAAGALSAIFVTHEHIDHISGLHSLAARWQASVIANKATLEACAEREEAEYGAIELPTGGSYCVGDLQVTSFPIPHDAVEPVGYVVSSPTARIASQGTR